MNTEDKNFNPKETTIDLQRLVGAVVDKLWLVALVAVLCALITFLGTFYLVSPKYTASSMFYVNNGDFSLGGTSFSISSADISASRNLARTYIVVLKTRETLVDVIDYAGVDRTYAEVAGMISAASVNNTEIFEIQVTSDDPQEATKIAHAIEEILPSRIKKIIEGSSAKVVDTAIVPAAPSSPSYSNNAIIGFLVGAIATIVLLSLRELFDIAIHTEEDINGISPYPVLVSVPDMLAPSKGGYYYYGYGSKRRQESSKTPKDDDRAIIGSKISFVASEAYKRLRTKLQFSFADEQDSRVIGISSAMSGEGKSISSVNLAFSLSQLGKKVVLVDCDMRRPSLMAKLHIEKAPGLSGYLSGQTSFVELIQDCGLEGEEDAFKVIVSGRNPPNPIELLSSHRMQELVGFLREKFDFIILDLPPVGEVSDALAVAEQTDGFLLVVRQHYCNRMALSDTLRQFSFVNAKILGVIFNCTNETSNKYGYRKGYYKRYYKRYYHRYTGSYASSARRQEHTVEKKVK